MDKIKKVFEDMKEDDKVLKMQKFRHHQAVSTYSHSIHVAQAGLDLAKRFHFSSEAMNNIVIGAMLHDYFLYDYHETGRITHKGLHAWKHPEIALANAKFDFRLNKKQENIIRSHMFPLTLFHPPKCKEAWVICLVDKICAIQEYIQKASNPCAI